MALPTYTAAQAAYQLTNGYWGGQSHSWSLDASRTVTYSFASSMSAAERKLAEDALETWSNIANLHFTQVSSGQIRFTNASSGAYTNFNYNWSGNLTSASVNISTSWLTSYGSTTGSYGLQTYIHEIGHALGLGHTGNYNGTANFATNALYANDSWQTSIMSYFSQDENTYTTASFAYLLTPMAFDIAAIRSLYGAATEVHGGNTTYGAGSNAGDSLDYLGTAKFNPSVAFTLVDSSGTDLIDFSAVAGAARIDLTPGAVSDVFGKIGNMVISTDTLIENLRTGAGADVLTGNEAANDLSSGAGNDSLDGKAGNDTLTGGAGNDTLTGGAGNDSFVFGLGFGSDRITDFGSGDLIDITALVTLTNWTDVVALMAQSAAGVTIATLQGSILLAGVSMAAISAASFLLVSGPGVEGVVEGRVMVGAAGVDTLIGGTGDDTIDGGAGNDSISAGLGDDSVTGGAGNDRIRLEGGDDRFVDTADAGADQVWGGAGNDVLVSLGGKDTLYGDDGNDVLTASDLGSQMVGGLGDDSITGGAGADIVTDTGGNDRVSLGAGNDRYTASGDTAAGGDSVSGGDGADTLSCGGGNDTILGDAGNDVISAGDGADVVTGGAGSDRIDLGAGDDRVVDAADGTADTVMGGAGNDVLISLGGRDQMDGGAGDDQLQACDAGSVLSGGTGNDTITGAAGADSVSDSGGTDLVNLGAGNDSFSGSGDLSTNADTVRGGDGADRISCSAGNDLILGEAGNDTLLGGAGNDRILAGTGNDLLTGGTGNDVFVFVAGDGFDRITDFRIGQDRIDLTALDGLASWSDLSAHLAQSGRAVVISFDDVSVTLDNLKVTALTASDFLF